MTTFHNQPESNRSLLDDSSFPECVPAESRRAMPEQPIALVSVRVVPRAWRATVRSAGLSLYMRCLQLKVALIG